MMLTTISMYKNLMVKLWYGHSNGNLDLELILFSEILFLSQLNSINILKLIPRFTQLPSNVFLVLLRMTGIPFTSKVLLDRCSISTFALTQATLHKFVAAS